MMKDLEEIKETEIKRPPRAEISEEEAVKRMKAINERKEKLLEIARKSKNGNLSS